jgi:hypothetical protein
MIRIIQISFLGIIFVLGMIGCFAVPQIETQVESTNTPIISPATNTYTPIPTPTFATKVVPDSVKKELSYLLQTNGGCKLPCFWGIILNQTSYAELYGLIHRLEGGGLDSPLGGGILRVSSSFRFEERSGIYIPLDADVQNDKVVALKVAFSGLLEPGVSFDDWSAYTMKEVLKTYGVPTSIELFLDFPDDMVAFGIRLKYEEIHMSITYDGSTSVNDENLNSSSAIVCPEKFGVNYVTLHLGEHPINYGPDGVSLLKATDLDTQAFYKLFIDNPSACITTDRDAMRQ